MTLMYHVQHWNMGKYRNDNFTSDKSMQPKESQQVAEVSGLHTALQNWHCCNADSTRQQESALDRQTYVTVIIATQH